MPALPESVPPMPSTGRSSIFFTSTLWLSSPLSVFRSDADSVTVTDSVAEPTSRLISIRRVCATSTVRPERVYFLKPGTETVT